MPFTGKITRKKEQTTQQGTQALEASITSRKTMKSSQLKHTSVWILNQLMNIIIQEIDGVPKNSSGLETPLFHP